jgi:hypothetical protein
MSLVAPVEEYDSPCSQCCGCSPGAAIPPEYWTFPQAWKLSTALLGRNRSGSGRGGSRVASVRQGDLGPTTQIR